MRGQRRAVALADQKFLLEARTLPEYWLFSLGSYPGLVNADTETGNSIAGEVYCVDLACRRRLDEIECVDDGLYELREVQLEDVSVNESISGPVFAYFYLGSVDGCERLRSWADS